MQPRTRSRDLSNIVFCMLGIIALNSFAHHDFNGITNPVEAIKQLFGIGGSLRMDYQELNLYQLLDKFAFDPKDLAALKGVAIEGQILRQKAIDPTEMNPGAAEKVGRTFILSRRFAETQNSESSKVLWVRVKFDNPRLLQPNMWVRVQGQVVEDPESKPENRPLIRAVQVDKLDRAPDNPIITPQGDTHAPGMDEHDHAHF